MSIQPGSQPWGPHDTELWHACEIAYDLAHGVVPAQEVATPFPPRRVDDPYLRSASFQLLEMRALGDGSYTHSSSFAFGTGTLGLALVAGSMVANHAANESRRNRAAQDAVPRWVPIDQGTLFASRFGFTMQCSGLFHWDHTSIESAEMVAPGHVAFHGNADRGRIHWVLASECAELVFVLWAAARHPRHPQLLSGGWLPPDWPQRARAAGYPTRLHSTPRPTPPTAGLPSGPD